MILRTHDEELRLAVARLMAILPEGVPVANSEDEEDELCHYLTQVVVNSEEKYPPLLVQYAIVILSTMAMDIAEISMEVAASGVPSVLAKKLKYYAHISNLNQFFDSKEILFTPPSCVSDEETPPLTELVVYEGNIALRELLAILSMLKSIGEHPGVIAPILLCDGIDSLHRLISLNHVNIAEAVFLAITSLAKHQKFCSVFVEQELSTLLSLPASLSLSNEVTHSLATCIGALISHPITVEEICDRSEQDIRELFDFALEIMSISWDLIRKAGALLISKLVSNTVCAAIFENNRYLERIVVMYNETLQYLITETIKSYQEEMRRIREKSESLESMDFEEGGSWHSSENMAPQNDTQEGSQQSQSLSEELAEILDDQALDELLDGEDLDEEEDEEEEELDDDEEEEATSGLLREGVVTLRAPGNNRIQLSDILWNPLSQILNRNLFEGTTSLSLNDKKFFLQHLSTVVLRYLSNILMQCSASDLKYERQKTIIPSSEELEEAVNTVRLNQLSLSVLGFEIFSENKTISYLIQFLYYDEKYRLFRLSLDIKVLLIKILWILTASKSGSAALLESQLSLTIGETENPEGNEANEIKYGDALTNWMKLMKTCTSPPVVYYSLKIFENFLLKPPSDSKQNHGPQSPALYLKRSYSDISPFFKNRDESSTLFKSAYKAVANSGFVSTLFNMLAPGQILSRFSKKTTPNFDDIRTEACKLLHALSSSPTIKQILSKRLARMTPDLIKELSNSQPTPSFKKYKTVSLELYSHVTGRNVSKMLMDVSSGADMMERASIVQNTSIDYSQEELYELMYKHLISKGLFKTAQSLLDEAGLDTTHLNANVIRRKQKKSRGPTNMPTSENGFIEGEDEFTLDTVVRQFLFDQHKRCVKPTQIVPKFSLKSKHQCPISTAKYNLTYHTPSQNSARRMMQRELGTPKRLLESNWRKFIHSRIKPTPVYFSDDTADLVSAVYVDDQYIYASTSAGIGIKFDTHSEVIVDDWIFHDYSTKLTYSYPTQMFLSYSSGRVVKLWQKDKLLDPISTFTGDSASFSPGGDIFSVVSNDGVIQIYDATTSEITNTLHFDKEDLNFKTHEPIPSFSPDSSLLLFNYTLWDCRSPQPIHIFDKFSGSGPNAFGSNGLEVITGTEIWDLRTFRLLKNCPYLDYSFIRFNQPGDVIYAGSTDTRDKIRVIDALTYDLITEYQHTSMIQDIAIHPDSTQLAVLEMCQDDYYRNGISCRIWSVGTTGQYDQVSDEEDDDGGMTVQPLFGNENDDEDSLSEEDSLDHSIASFDEEYMSSQS